MHLDKEQQERVLEHLNKALKKPPRCPVCEDANWGITDEVFEIRGFHEGEKRTGEAITTQDGQSLVTIRDDEIGR